MKKQNYQMSACGNYYELKIVKRDGSKYMCLFDVGDLAIVQELRWFVGNHGYAFATVPKALQHLYKTKYVLMHQLILKPEAPLVSDHISGIRLNNRRVNLRSVPVNINNRNRFKQANTFSIYKGVYAANSKTNPFFAQIKINKKLYYLGNFPTEELAALAYNKKALANGFILKTPNKELEI